MKYVIPVSQIDQISDGEKQEFELHGNCFLVIKYNENIHVIQNQCGHFGMPMDDGILEGDSITCTQHFVQFNLYSGEVMNQMVESCDSLRIYEWKIENQELIIFYE